MIWSSRRIAVIAALGVVASCSAGGSGSSTASGAGGGATASSESSSGATASSTTTSVTSGAGGAMCGSSYDQMILCDHPVAFWAMNQAPADEPDLTGDSNTGVYKGGAPALTTLPNGDKAAVFNGSSE